jgi:hypothetical protein
MFVCEMSFRPRSVTPQARQRFEGLVDAWIASGALEIAAYRPLADPTSKFVREGRELAAKVEEATVIHSRGQVSQCDIGPQGEPLTTVGARREVLDCKT